MAEKKKMRLSEVIRRLEAAKAVVGDAWVTYSGDIQLRHGYICVENLQLSSDPGAIEIDVDLDGGKAG